MYQIDLLKGKGVPVNESYRQLCFVGIGAVLPIFLFIVLIAYGIHDRVVLKVHNNVVKNYQERLQDMSYSLNEVEKIYTKGNLIYDSSLEVSGFLEWQTQWTNILSCIEQVWPETFLLDEMEVKIRNRSVKVSSREDKGKKVNVTMPIRTLAVTMHTTSPAYGDEIIKSFQNDIMKSDLLAGIVRDVVLTNREPGKRDGKEVINYEVDLILYDQEG